MERGSTGTYQSVSTAGETFKAFVPAPLPPTPPIVLSNDLLILFEQATRALGKLDGLSLLLPDISLFLYFYVRKEAVLSSQIEGTQSSLSDLLRFEFDEAPGVPTDDVQEVSQYVAALNYGLKRLREDNFPLSSRLLREVHEVLLSSGRGATKEPGNFRASQNWIGGTRPGNAHFVPPPHNEVPACIGALEQFLNSKTDALPTLIKAALAHVQFETIHPFLDGNGRIGRLLITLLLCADGVLQEPLLYLSYYFKRNRKTYYELLDAVRLRGDWETWLEFFLTGVRDVAEQAADGARKILVLFDKDRRLLEPLGRPAASALRVHHYLQRHPLISIGKTANALHVTAQTVIQALRVLEEKGIVEEITGRQRDRIFTYATYLKLLDEGTTTANRNSPG
ncbi:MAG: Fic family protein [Fibrella sp.]|nr:Fic family protein [Armatimonadota bacterium]